MCVGIEAGSPTDGNGIYSGNGSTTGTVEVTLGAGIKFSRSAKTIEIDPGEDSGIIGLTEQFSNFIEAPSDKTYVLILKAKYPFDIVNLTTKTASGDFTLSLQIGGIAVSGIDMIFVSSIEATSDATSLNSVLAGDEITLVVSTSMSPVDWSYTMETVRTA